MIDTPKSVAAIGAKCKSDIARIIRPERNVNRRVVHPPTDGAFIVVDASVGPVVVDLVGLALAASGVPATVVDRGLAVAVVAAGRVSHTLIAA